MIGIEITAAGRAHGKDDAAAAAHERVALNAIVIGTLSALCFHAQFRFPAVAVQPDSGHRPVFSKPVRWESPFALVLGECVATDQVACIAVNGDALPVPPVIGPAAALEAVVCDRIPPTLEIQINAGLIGAGEGIARDQVAPGERLGVNMCPKAGEIDVADRVTLVAIGSDETGCHRVRIVLCQPRFVEAGRNARTPPASAPPVMRPLVTVTLLARMLTA